MEVRRSVLILSLLAGVGRVLAQPGLSSPVAALDTLDGLGLEGSGRIVPDGPGGARVLRVDGEFSGRVDLKPRGIDPKAWDLLKLEVKSARGGFLVVSLENYPAAGELSHWYVLDGMRGPFDWRTIWIDLKRPEEIKAAGRYKGMGAEDASLRGLQIRGKLRDIRRRIQEPGDSMWLARIRFARKAVDLDWDQTQAPCTWERGKDLVYTYPLRVTNRLDRPLTVRLSLTPFEVRDAKAALSADRVELGPKQTRTVEATVWLPADVAADRPPLYAERFEVRAAAEGVPDSEVTILRSADPIHLTVTVPIAEDKLAFPMLPRRKDLPASILNFDRAAAERAAGALTMDAVEAAFNDRGVEKAGVLNSGVSSAAFLYDLTGDRKYLRKVHDVLVRMAELYSRKHRELYSKPIQCNSHGVLARNVLQFCFKFGGTQRPPYYYGGTRGNAANGRMHGLMNAFDLVAADLDDRDRRKIIDDLLVPAAIQARNHYIGPGNQQSTSNYVVLYGGLAARNWPLAAFAYSAEHGLLGNLKWAFDDDGLCLEGHYQAYTISPILWMTELLYACGVDRYDPRLYQIIHSPGARAIGAGYGYPIVGWLDRRRFGGKPFVRRLAAEKTDGCHLTASTLLSWKQVQVAMNWGTHIYRSSHDRCALTVRTPRRNRALAPLAVGGGSYNHSSFGQSILVVDEQLQNTEPAKVVSYDVTGPVQHVTAVADRHYPGSTITRTFALIDRHVLVVDRVVNDRPRTVDWQLLDAGGKLSVPTQRREGSWIDKPDDTRRGTRYGAGVEGYDHASTEGAWSEGDGRLRMLGAPGTELMVWKNRKGTHLTVRRTGVTETDFAAIVSLNCRSIRPAAVSRADGRPADAVGATVTLEDGKVFHAIVSYEPNGTKVSLGSLTTDQPFATDFEP